MRRGWRTMAPLLRNARPLIAVTVLVAALQSALLIPIAFLVQRVFDTLLPRSDGTGVVLAGAAMLALYLASGALNLLSRGLVVRSTKRAIAELRHELLSRLYAMAPTWHDRRGRGWVHGVLVQDTERVDQAVNQVLTQSGPAIVVLGALSGVALVLDPVLFGVLAAVVPILLLADRRLGRRLQTRVQAWHRGFDEYSADAYVALRSLPTTQVQGAEAWELRRRRTQLGELADAGTSLVWSQSAYSVAQGTVAAAAGIVVLVVGGLAVTRGAMTVGELLSFYAVVALMLRQLSVVLAGIPVILMGRPAFARIDEVLTAQAPAAYDGEREMTVRGTWSLEHVTFGYDERDVLHDLSLQLGAGECVALVGPNGAGKSTAVNLLLGLYRPDRGCVRIDGIALDDLDVRHVRRQIGVVLQDPVLFRATVHENIAYGRDGVTEAEVRAAAVRSTADSFVSALPLGYRTPIGDDAVRLSGGERQRVAIARALLGEPALLVLDEPTIHLDAASIDALMANLAALHQAPTVLIVTHDAAIAACADRILHLRDGRVVREERRARVAGARAQARA
jgi:ABC-type multidrug transport system fused ATPase/permease subunit